MVGHGGTFHVEEGHDMTLKIRGNMRVRDSSPDNCHANTIDCLMQIVYIFYY